MNIVRTVLYVDVRFLRNELLRGVIVVSEVEEVFEASPSSKMPIQ